MKWLLQTITNAVESYENDTHPIYFDYDGAIGLLEQVQILVTESARCPRPTDLPPGMPWSERLAGGDEVFDPYVFDGTMSDEDYERMHKLMAADSESEGMER